MEASEEEERDEEEDDEELGWQPCSVVGDGLCDA